MSFINGLAQSAGTGQFLDAAGNLIQQQMPNANGSVQQQAVAGQQQNAQDVNQILQQTPGGDPNAAITAMPFPQVGLEMGGPVPGTRQQPVIRRNAGSRTAAPPLVRGPSSGVIPGRMQSPQDPGTPMLARGGVMPRRAALPAGGPMTAATGVPGYSTGGAIPAGPQQGIVPASTEGQMVTMDAGGVMPDSYVGVPQNAPQVQGRAAGLASGLAEGQALGHNLVSAWHQHQARDAAQQEGQTAADIESQTTGVSQQPQLSLDDHVSNFMYHLSGGLLGTNHQPQSGGYDAQGMHNPVTNEPIPPTTAATPGAIPSAAPSGAAPPGAAAPAASPVVPARGPVQPGQIPGTQAQPGQPANMAPAPGTPGYVAPGEPPAGQGGRTATVVAQGMTQQNAQDAAASGPAQTGKIPPSEQAPAHSLSPDWWEHSERLKMTAMQNAWKQGKDPAVVGASLDAIRTGAVQGQLMRYTSALNTAIDNGNDDDVKNAIKNINYFLPNGANANIKTATAADVKANDALGPAANNGVAQPGFAPGMHVGAIMHQNPFYGLAGYENSPKFQPIDKIYAGQLMENIRDPANVNKALIEQYKAQRETEAKLLTAQGRADIGSAGLIKARSIGDWNKASTQTRLDLMGSAIDVNESKAGLNKTKAQEATTPGQPKITMAGLRNAANDASKAVDDAVQGPMETQPTMITGPDGRMSMNMSPGAGKTTRNAAKADPLFKGMSAEDANRTKDLAANLGGANATTSSGIECAQAAARVIKYNHQATAHIDPATHQAMQDVVRDPAQGTISVWDGREMRHYFMRANVSDSQEAPSAGGEGGAEGGNPADYEPAREASDATEASVMNDNG